ncbi:MAG: lipoprotein [Duganella sp.]
MKSSIRYAITPIIGATTVCLTVLLSGCGQPGPLYLPKPPAAKPAKSGAVPASPATVPPAPVMPTPGVPPTPSPATVPSTQ